VEGEGEAGDDGSYRRADPPDRRRDSSGKAIDDYVDFDNSRASTQVLAIEIGSMDRWSKLEARRGARTFAGGENRSAGVMNEFGR
jgi:hypothetical protein